MPLIIDVPRDLADHVDLRRQLDLFVLVTELHVKYRAVGACRIGINGAVTSVEAEAETAFADGAVFRIDFLDLTKIILLRKQTFILDALDR